jgi:hypothetical protein
MHTEWIEFSDEFIDCPSGDWLYSVPLGSTFNVVTNEEDIIVAIYEDGGEFAKYKSWLSFFKGIYLSNSQI